MMEGYTRWEYDADAQVVFDPDCEDGLVVAVIEPYEDADDIGRLIAAAPEMYSLIVNALRMCKGREVYASLHRRASEVIARIDDWTERGGHNECNER